MGFGLAMLVAANLSIAVSGNGFVNGSGQPIQLHGVDRPGTEYACVDGYAYSDGAEDAADAASIAAWHVNAVRIPLNEDCWLGINGEPAYGTAAGYQQSIEAYVSALNADGIYAILDLHWSAPGTVVSDGQRPMPDNHSAAFWTSVATAFESNPAVVFDVFNEPYSPAADLSDASAYPVSWSCWRNGGCTLPVTADGNDPGTNPQTYTAVGMQPLITAIRNTGATQPIMVGGLSYSNDLSGWLANEPSDPDHQLAASVHVYEGENCSSDSCWNSEVAPVAAQVPVVAGEFGGNDDCGGTDGADFDDDFMDWADAHSVSYLAWGWYEGETFACGSGDYYLINADGSPAAPNGTSLHSHLAALAASPPSSGTTPTPTPTPTTTTPTTTPTTTTPAATTPSPGSASTTTSTPATTTSTPAATSTPAPGATTPKPTATTPAATAVHRTTKPACVVPKLHGLTLTKARRKLAVAHCRLGKVRRPRASRHKATLVIGAQSPKPGQHLANEARVSVTLKHARS